MLSPCSVRVVKASTRKGVAETRNPSPLYSYSNSETRRDISWFSTLKSLLKFVSGSSHVVCVALAGSRQRGPSVVSVPVGNVSSRGRNGTSSGEPNRSP
ncbi:hypothetical protein O3P69_001315 [Scylla paramamosain]|uniref:Uncharacterized protein n=1 Tax=Scylla paramamosain TaxID=85552 RepID=A0AAW0UR45_SCYPA